MPTQNDVARLDQADKELEHSINLVNNKISDTHITLVQEISDLKVEVAKKLISVDGKMSTVNTTVNSLVKWARGVVGLFLSILICLLGAYLSAYWTIHPPFPPAQATTVTTTVNHPNTFPDQYQQSPTVTTKVTTYPKAVK
jgi:hypothetical protein